MNENIKRVTATSPSRKRDDVVGGIYHLVQRGNDKIFIFENDTLKKHYLNLMFENRAEFNYEILCYAIMNNHYHFIIQTNGASLSIIMHTINTKFSKFYNNYLNHLNHVFGERFGAKLVTNVDYLLCLLKYIHLNPVNANLCDTVHDYQWSSDYFYMNNLNEFVNIDIILDIFSKDRNLAIKKYLDFMNSGEPSDYVMDNLLKIDVKNLIDLKYDNSELFQFKTDDSKTGAPKIEDFKTILDGSRLVNTINSANPAKLIVPINPVNPISDVSPINQVNPVDQASSINMVSSASLVSPEIPVNSVSPAIPEDTKKEIYLDKPLLTEIMNYTITNNNLIESAKSGSTSHDLTLLKIDYIKECLRHSYTVKEIADSLNITPTAVYRLRKL